MGKPGFPTPLPAGGPGRPQPPADAGRRPTAAIGPLNGSTAPRGCGPEARAPRPRPWVGFGRTKSSALSLP